MTKKPSARLPLLIILHCAACYLQLVQSQAQHQQQRRKEDQNRHRKTPPPFPEVDPIVDGIYLRRVTLPTAGAAGDAATDEMDCDGNTSGGGVRSTREKLVMYDFRPAFPPYTEERLRDLLLIPEKERGGKEEAGVRMEEGRLVEEEQKEGEGGQMVAGHDVDGGADGQVAQNESETSEPVDSSADYSDGRQEDSSATEHLVEKELDSDKEQSYAVMDESGEPTEPNTIEENEDATGKVNVGENEYTEIDSQAKATEPTEKQPTEIDAPVEEDEIASSNEGRGEREAEIPDDHLGDGDVNVEEKYEAPFQPSSDTINVIEDDAKIVASKTGLSLNDVQLLLQQQKDFALVIDELQDDVNFLQAEMPSEPNGEFKILYKNGSIPPKCQELIDVFKEKNKDATVKIVATKLSLNDAEGRGIRISQKLEQKGYTHVSFAINGDAIELTAKKTKEHDKKDKGKVPLPAARAAEILDLSLDDDDMDELSLVLVDADDEDPSELFHTYDGSGTPDDVESGTEQSTKLEDDTAAADADDVIESVSAERDEPELSSAATEFDLESQGEASESSDDTSDMQKEGGTVSPETDTDTDNPQQPEEEERIRVQYDDNIDAETLPSSSSILSSTSNNKEANRQFVDGLDEIDKLFESVEVPDELDVGADGSSMQDVLVGQAVKIIWKRAKFFGRNVKDRWNKIKSSKVAENLKGGLLLGILGNDDDDDYEEDVVEELSGAKKLWEATKRKWRDILGNDDDYEVEDFDSLFNGKKMEANLDDDDMEPQKREIKLPSFVKSPELQKILDITKTKWKQATRSLDGLFNMFGEDDGDDDADDISLGLGGEDESFLSSRYEAMLTQQQQQQEQ